MDHLFYDCLRQPKAALVGQEPFDLYADAGIEQLFIEEDNRKVMAICLAQLPIRERMIVELYIGWDSEAKTLTEIATKIHRSTGRAGQLCKRGIERLRRLLHGNGYFN